MPGGERAAREPWRMACAAIQAAGADPEAALPSWTARRTRDEIAAARFSLESGSNAPRTSSCGRLFDAVASLAGLYDSAQFEAQAAIALEFAAGDLSLPPYPHVLEQTTIPGDAEAPPIVLSFLPAIQEIIHDMRIGKSAAEISVRFHAAVVDGCVDMVERISRRSGLRCVALSGGSFQNALLLRGMIASLRERNYTVLTHTQVPANDGGIALGQAVVTHAHLRG